MPARGRVSGLSSLLLPALFVCLPCNGAVCESLHQSSQLALNERRYQDAIHQLRLAKSECANSEPVLLSLAKVYIVTERYTEAASVLKELQETQPRSSAAWKLQGDILYLQGRDAEAIAAFEEALKRNPKSEEAVYALGRVYYQLARFEQARGQFERCLELNPKSYRAHDNLALALEALNLDGPALKHYLAALELVHKDHPEYDWVYANLASFLLKRGEYKKAFDLAVEAAHRNPGSGRNCYIVAKALARLDKSELSLTWLTRAIELEPEYPDAHYMLSQLYRKQGKVEEANNELARFRALREKVPSKLR
jgi:tetratricopeptide (TPR) repeat protein